MILLRKIQYVLLTVIVNLVLFAFTMILIMCIVETLSGHPDTVKWQDFFIALGYYIAAVVGCLRSDLNKKEDDNGS